MSTERFVRLKKVFLAALRLPEEERAGYLDTIGREDESLRREVEDLMEREKDVPAAMRTGGLGRLVDTLLGKEAPPYGDAPMPESVGPYRICDVLGEGGMGVVYRAEQTEPIRREVALKLIRGGADSAAVLARFDAERQSLAQMNHPNIATVLDAGSDNGRPYFVMELVHGSPITDYCRTLSPDVRQRLRVFLDVCRAVRHAHRRGIIHRDLKPSNILVSQVGGEAVPKVIDFSIAKALEDPAVGTEFRTRTGQILGTLEYMSPEQARGAVGEVDTRSDVYSLGVVLHELLAGRLPYDLEGIPPHEALQRIVEEPAPRRRGGTTTGADRDLETILGKCLEKDPDRRYHSAAELVEDLERYLVSRPILARPPTVTYQLRTLVRRHRVAFGVTAGAFVLLAAFAVTVSVQLGRQSRERARAEAAAVEAQREARRARRVNDFLREMLASAAPAGKGKDLTVRQVLDESAERIDADLAAEPESLADAHHTMGVSYGGLGDDEAAVEHLRQALALHREIIGEDSRDVAEDRRELADALYRRGDYDEAVAAAREALAWWRATEGPGREATPPEMIALFNTLTTIEGARGNLDEAETLAREIVERVQLDRPGDRAAQADAEMILALVLRKEATERSRQEAEPLIRHVVEIRREILAADHPSTLESLNLLALILNRLGSPEEAMRIHYDVLLRRRRSLDPDHPDVAASANNLATTLLGLGYTSAAAPFAKEAFQIWEATYGENHPYVVVAVNNLSYMSHCLGELEQAERYSRDALARVGRQPDPARRQTGEYNLIHLLRDRGRNLEEAEGYARAYMQRHLDRDPESVEQALGARDLGLILLEQGRLSEAEPLFQQALDLFEERGRPGGWGALGARFGLAVLKARTEGREAALPYLTPVEEHLLSEGSWPTNQVRYTLRKAAELHDAWGDTEEAEACRREMARRDAKARSKPDLTSDLDPELLAFLTTAP